MVLGQGTVLDNSGYTSFPWCWDRAQCWTTPIPASHGAGPGHSAGQLLYQLPMVLGQGTVLVLDNSYTSFPWCWARAQCWTTPIPASHGAGTGHSASAGQLLYQLPMVLGQGTVLVLDNSGYTSFPWCWARAQLK